jgi:hypothetical protein
MAKAVTLSKLPPHGFINTEFLDGADTTIPPNFMIAGAPASLAQYQAWVAALADEIADTVWPRYDPASGTWRGGAARKAMALTLADLELLETLKPRFDTRITARGPGGTHADFFEEEDGAHCVVIGGRPRPAPVGWSYGLYDDQLPAAVVDQVRQAFSTSGIQASGVLDIQLKQFLQRPRAYQVALLLGRPDYAYHWARSAASPSMVSGHALQSTVAACHVFLTLGAQLQSVPDGLVHWSQFSVDMGDRRVFAGVHYPSDNIASWFCTLRLARQVFGPRAPEARRFLWAALQQHSIVFDAIRSAAVRGSPYVKLLKWLTDEATAA